MIRKALIAAGLVAVIGLTIYHFLGGTEPLDISLIENKGYKLAGRYYEGKITDKALEEIFFETKDLIAKGELPGTLVVVYFNQPEKENGFVQNLIGVEIPEALQKLPAGYDLRTIDCTRSVKVDIQSHSAVLPRPEEVQAQVEQFAKKNNLSLQKINIEKYISESQLIIEVPVVNQ
jgi:predicted transcriptional regulator YdeE